MEAWKARDRICGRSIVVGFDPEGGTIEAPELCPECGARLNGVDILAPAELKWDMPTSAGAHVVESTPAPIASSAARELAESEGIELATVTGTGAEGAITMLDVLQALAERTHPEVSQESSRAPEGRGDS